MSEVKKRDTRTRNFAFVLYEDSCSPTWKSDLVNLHIPHMWIYHDKDCNPDGTLKKPHYHLIVKYENKKSDVQIQELANNIKSANNQFQKVESLCGYARYFCHLDNPEKTQYELDKVYTYGIDYISICSNVNDKYKSIKEIIQFIEKENIISYKEILEYASINNEKWFHCLCDNGTMVILEYIKSRYWLNNH